MYVLCRKVAQAIVIGPMELIVKRVKNRNLLATIGDDVYDFDEGDSFQLSEDVEVKALSIKGSNARIGVDAPRDIEIIRPEAAQREDSE